MKPKIRIWILLVTVFIQSGPQMLAQQEKSVYVSKDAKASFFSSAPLEDIEALNGNVSAAMNIKTGEVFFRVPIKDFEFEKSLMQKHFNDQYMESDKYPEANFTGKLLGWTGNVSGKTELDVEGELSIHGVTRSIREKVELSPQGPGFRGVCSFEVRLKDHNIKVPRMVVKNIAEVVSVTIDAEFKPSE